MSGRQEWEHFKRRLNTMMRELPVEDPGRMSGGDKTVTRFAKDPWLYCRHCGAKHPDRGFCKCRTKAGADKP